MDDLRDVAVATNFRTKIAINWVCVIDKASEIAYEGACAVNRQNADITDTLKLREVAMATAFGTTLAVSGFWREITTRGFRIKDG